MFEKLSDAVGSHYEACRYNCEIVLERESDSMKTVIVENTISQDWWLFQSSHITEDGKETVVDIIRLEKPFVADLSELLR